MGEVTNPSVAAAYNFGISMKDKPKDINPFSDDPWRKAYFDGWDSDGVRIQWRK